MKKLLKDLWSFLALALILIGIGSVSLHLLKTDGWLSTLTGKLWDAEIEHPLIMTPAILGALALGWACLTGHLVIDGKNRLADLLVFALMLMGAYYAYYWLRMI